MIVLEIFICKGAKSMFVDSEIRSVKPEAIISLCGNCSSAINCLPLAATRFYSPHNLENTHTHWANVNKYEECNLSSIAEFSRALSIQFCGFHMYEFVISHLKLIMGNKYLYFCCFYPAHVVEIVIIVEMMVLNDNRRCVTTVGGSRSFWI